MPSGSEQPADPQTRKRSKTTSTGEQQPLPLSKLKEPSKSAPSPETDGHIFEPGIMDPPRSRTSVVRYDNPPAIRTTAAHLPSAHIPQRRTREMPHRVVTEPGKQEKSGRKVHWLLLVGLGMMATLALWVTGSWVVAWSNQRLNDVRYGNPRTSQIDTVVGHGDDSPAHPSHFIAINYNRQAVIIEFMAGDPAKSVSYVAPIYIAGDGGDLAPVTLEFRDVTGDGKKDMLVHILLPTQQDQVSVFVNDGKGKDARFRAPNSNDKIRS